MTRPYESWSMIQVTFIDIDSRNCSPLYRLMTAELNGSEKLSLLILELKFSINIDYARHRDLKVVIFFELTIFCHK